MRLSIKDQIGPRCIIKEDGQKIYDAIHGALQNGETVCPACFSDYSRGL